MHRLGRQDAIRHRSAHPSCCIACRIPFSRSLSAVICHALAVTPCYPVVLPKPRTDLYYMIIRRPPKQATKQASAPASRAVLTVSSEPWPSALLPISSQAIVSWPSAISGQHLSAAHPRRMVFEPLLFMQFMFRFSHPRATG